MPDRQIPFFALALSGLIHLLAWLTLSYFYKGVPQPLVKPVFVVDMVQVSLAEPTKMVAPPPALQPALTSNIPDDIKHVAAITTPIQDLPPPVSQAGAIAVTEPNYKVSYLNNPAPEYPLLARRRGLEGSVLLHVQVLSDGSSATVNVKTSSGHALLDNAAQATVRRWRFVPAMQGNEAVSAWVEVPIVFKLER